MLSDAFLVVRKVAQALDALGVPYLLGGSMASGIQGLPRSTRDVDFAADLDERHVEPLAAALEAEFYVDAEMIRDAIQSRSSFNVIHLDTMYKADVFVPSIDAWSQEQMARRQLKRLSAEEDSPAVYVASPEDIILQKLRWYKMGGGVSDRQWGDVTGVLKVQADALDVPYLQHWGGALGISDLLERAMEDAGLKEGGDRAP